MNNRGGRQFSRGRAVGGDPLRRRRFHGQYVRRRSPPNGYRGGSFSDDRNDSSPPPNSSNRPMPTEEPSFVPQHYQQRINRNQPRGPRLYDPRNPQRDPQLYDNHQRSSQTTNARNNFEASDNEFNDQDKKFDELTRSLQGQKTDIDEIRVMFSKLNTELDLVKTRVKELESKREQQPQAVLSKESGDWDQEKDKRRKFKLSKQREKKAAKLAEKRAAISETVSQPDRQQKILNPEQVNTSTFNKTQENPEYTDRTQEANVSKYNRRTNRERNAEKRRPRREIKNKVPKVNNLDDDPTNNKTVYIVPKVNSLNDDSTTQAAEPSSEDRPEGDDGRDGTVKERVRVFRRKKQHFGRRGNAYGNRRRRAGSSERNSNDTSPQGEANGNSDFQDKRKKNVKKTFPEISEKELSDVVQALHREFINLERPLKAIQKTMNSKGPKVMYEFAASILDHAICDVTSPTKLSEIANNLYQLIVSEYNTSDVNFQQGFYEALNDLSKREDDIAIDAPRYMDTLGQVLADCIIPMYNKHRYLVKKFLNKCLESYCQHNRAVLLANIMRGIAGTKNDRFAKDVWNTAELSWDSILNEGTDLMEFLESLDVSFTIQEFSPEPRKTKKIPKELEKFADDVTSMVETRCTSQTLDDFVKDLNLESDDRIDYLGTLLYAIVRGCLVTDSGACYKLNNDALNKYSSILNTKHEEQDDIALHALTALTKLWHQYNCPQDLLRTILMALHNHGTASYEALKVWLNSDSLTNIPGIGAARLNSKRYIEDLGANLKS